MAIAYKQALTRRELKSAFNVRQAVFTIEQRIPPEADIDDKDKDAVHLIAVKDGKIVGTLRVFREGDDAVIGRMAVLKEDREKGVGTNLMKLAIKKSKEMGARYAVAGAQVRACAFYEKMGFKKTKHTYVEVGIPHIEMKLKL
jgi:predicted GNAT family N-acyltransferase